MTVTYSRYNSEARTSLDTLRTLYELRNNQSRMMYLLHEYADRREKSYKSVAQRSSEEIIRLLSRLAETLKGREEEIFVADVWQKFEAVNARVEELFRLLDRRAPAAVFRQKEDEIHDLYEEMSGLVEKELFLYERNFARADKVFRGEAIRIMQLNFLAVPAVLLLLILLGGFISQRLARRLKLLAAAAAEMEKGNLSVRVDADSRDEVGALSASFNGMARKLKSLTEGLEQRVEERTVELENARRSTINLLKDVDEDRNKIARLYKDLQSVDRMKTEFLSVVSHELRTPLTPIKGYVSLLLDGRFGALNPEYKKAVEIIRKESDQLLNLIDGILDISRLERGKVIELEREPVLLRQIIGDVVESFGPQIEERKLTVETAFPSDFPTLMADRKQLLRLVTNLLGNAVKFTPWGGWIKISGEKSETEVEIAVADDGVGIARENLGKIFEKFYQVDGSYTRAAGGIGLGLAIARDIVTAHGGKIWAESAGEGLGSKFIFSLPISYNGKQ